MQFMTIQSMLGSAQEPQREALGAIVSPSYEEPQLDTAEVVFSSIRSPERLYRGVSDQEMRDIKRSGQIRSSSKLAKELNKSHHVGKTFFSDRPNVATSYIRDHGYVIEVNRETIRDLEDEGSGEFSTFEPIPVSSITRIFRIKRDEDHGKASVSSVLVGKHAPLDRCPLHI